MTTCPGKSCSFGLPRVPFVNCCQFMYFAISLLALNAGCGIWLYQFLIIAYLFTLFSFVILFFYFYPPPPPLPPPTHTSSPDSNIFKKSPVNLKINKKTYNTLKRDNGRCWWMGWTGVNILVWDPSKNMTPLSFPRKNMGPSKQLKFQKRLPSHQQHIPAIINFLHHSPGVGWEARAEGMGPYKDTATCAWA